MKKTNTIITLCVLAILVTSTAVVIFKRASAANAPVTQKNLNKGLVLHMTFDRDETADGLVTDSSSGNNNGIPSGIRWTPDGKLGGAYEFTKDGDRIVIKSNPSLTPAHLTLSAWIKTTTADSVSRRIFDKAYTQCFALSIAGDRSGLAIMEIGPGTHHVVSKTRLTDGQWHQVVSTFDGTDENLYVDGRFETTFKWQRPGRVGSGVFNLLIGCIHPHWTETDLGNSFRGFIDEPMMWNRALSEKEIAYLFQLQNGAPAGQLTAN